MTKQIDCRGLACPAPVLQTKEYLDSEKPASVEILVDNDAAGQNVTRFLESRNFQVSTEEKDGDILVIGKSGDPCFSAQPAAEKTQAEMKKIMIMVSTDRLGHGNDELGGKLMASFLTTLKEMGEELWRLIFVNNGVKLTTEEAEVLPVLRQLEKSGIQILVCGTCLTFFDLLDKKQVGETTNMLDIVTAMQLADKVISI